MENNEERTCISAKELKWKLKVRKAKDWMKNKIEDAQVFCENHKEVIAVGVPITVAIITNSGKIIKTAIADNKSSREDYWKETHVYDRSLGCYLEIKRPLTNDDITYINRRKARGERTSDILEDMRLLR